MNVEIFKKSDGSVKSAGSNVISLDEPSIVRIQIDRSNVKSMVRDGNDLIVTLNDGEAIRLVSFYSEENSPALHDLVLQETDGSLWLARPDLSSPFQEVSNWDALLSSSLAASEDGGLGIALPILGLAGAAGIAAAAGSGGGSGGSPATGPLPVPADTTPPTAITAELVDDSGIDGDGITNNGDIAVTGAEAGAKFQYSIDGGDTWVDATPIAGGFTLEEGEYLGIIVRQVDAAGNAGPATAPQDIIVDKTPPADITGAITDSGAVGDGETNVNIVTLTGVEDGATVQYRSDEDAEWADAELDADGNMILPDGTYTNLEIRQVDQAGNASGEAAVLPALITIDTGIPSAITAELVDDSGIDGDGITNNGDIAVVGAEADATFQYSIDGGDTWVDATPIAGGFTLDEGEYLGIIVRQVDTAGNAGPATAPQDIIVDKTPPADITGAITDSGAVGDGETNVNIVTLTGVEDNATVQYRSDEDAEWADAELDADGNMILPDGTYTNLEIRQVDQAGNASGEAAVLPALITIDTGIPSAITAELVDDSGIDGDGITNNGDIAVVGAEAGATFEYSTDGGVTWEEGLNATPSGFTLEEGEYLGIIVRQVDTAGNPGPATAPQDIIVDQTPPADITGAITDSGAVGDGETNVNIVTLTGVEDNATVQYRSDEDAEWADAELDADGNMILPDGTYTNLEIRQVDQAGNASGEAAVLPALITIDTGIPSAITAELVDDSGIEGDGITNNGDIVVTGAEPGATFEYSTDGGATWEEALNATPSGFTLDEGEYLGIIVRQVDAAGKAGPATVPQNIIVDITPPAAITGQWADDTGTVGDQITTNGRLNVSGVEANATVQYSVDGINWTAVDLVADGFVLPPADYTDLQLRQVDLAGNIGLASETPDFTVIAPIELDPVDDNITLHLGETIITSSGPSSRSDYEILELLEGEANYESGMQVILGGTQPGVISAIVQQTALVAVANAFAIELYDENGNLVARAVTDNSPLVGSALGLSVLGLVGDDGLSVEFTDLPPGTYYVVVVSDSPTLNDLVQDLTLAELGQGDALLGAENQAIILDALSDALAAQQYPFPEAVISAVGGVLTLANGTPLVPVVSGLAQVLELAGVTTGLDQILDAISAALLTNTATLLQKTDIATTAYSYDFENMSVTGDVFADNGEGVDAIVDEASTRVSNIETTAVSEPVPEGGFVRIEGQFGTLEISSDGSFSYISNGDPAAAGETDSFTYTVTDGVSVKTATISINITSDPAVGEPVDAVDDVATIDLGTITAVTHPTEVTGNVSVLEIAGGTQGYASGVPITVTADRSGSLEVIVRQGSLVAVADAFRLDVYNSAGEIVFSAVTAGSLVGDVLGLSVLGVLGNDGLVAHIEGLPPGEYYVNVSNDSSALNNIVQGLEISDLGDGAVLGDENQEIIINALTAALGNNPLADLAGFTVRAALTGLNGTPLTDVLDLVAGTLETVGLSLLVDDLIDAISDALLSNIVSVLERTEITTTLTEYDFSNETVSGNVLLGDAGVGADDVGAGAKVRFVTNSDGDSKAVVAGTATVIAGKHGVLTISADGSYEYAAYGSPSSINESERFTYGIGLPGSSDTAELVINLTGDPLTLTPDAESVGIVWANEVDTSYFNDQVNILGVLFPSRADSAEFSVTADIALSGTVRVNVTVAAVAEGSVFLVQESGSNWLEVAGTRQDFNIAVGLLGVVATIDLATLDLPPGTYRVATSLTGIAAATSTIVDIDATLLNSYVIDDVDSAAGNIFENDILGSFNTSIAIKSDQDLTFTNVEVDVEQQIAGDFGTLIIKSNGDFEYNILPNLIYSNSVREDIFDYQVTHPSGVTETNSLTIEITPSGAGVTLNGRLANDMSAMLDHYLGSEDNASAGYDMLAELLQEPPALSYLAPLPLEDESTILVI